jgi:hypothetical protein
MTGARLTWQRALAFGIGMLLVLLPLALIGRVESRGPACSLGLGRPAYPAYEGASYGWPLAAVQIGYTSCEGSPDTWTPKLSVAWHVDGVLISDVQLLAGGLLALVISSRVFKGRSG